MRTIITASVLVFTLVGTASAQQHVDGYYRSNGTYVQPYYRSRPDGNPYNNYSTRGNVNPYTGQEGTRSPYEGSNSGLGSYGNQQPSGGGLYSPSN